MTRLAIVMFLASISFCGRSIPIPDPGPQPVCQDPPGEQCSADHLAPCRDCWICDATSNFVWKERSGCPPVPQCDDAADCDCYAQAAEREPWVWRPCPVPTPTPTPTPVPTPTPEPPMDCRTLGCPSSEECKQSHGWHCEAPVIVPPPGPTCGPAPQGVILCNTDDNIPSCGCWKCGPKSDFQWIEKAPCPAVPSGDPCATCWKCPDLIQYQLRRGHLTPVQVTSGPRVTEIIYTDGTGSGNYVNKQCETVDGTGRFKYPPNAFLGGACWPESKWVPQCEGPSPTPTPVPEPTPGPTPTPGPLPAACPWQDGSSLSWVGIVSRGRVGVKTQGGEYLGWRYNFDATPHSKGKEYCAYHRPDQQQCDQLLACQDPRGPDFYMTLPGKWTNERCDKHSGNPYQCHHKPKADEVGPTTVCAVPAGDRPDSPRGRCVTVQVGR